MNPRVKGHESDPSLASNERPPGGSSGDNMRGLRQII